MSSKARFVLTALVGFTAAVAWMMHSCDERLSERVRGSENTAPANAGRFGGGPENQGGFPERIVVLSPAATQIVFALGVGSRVVAVTRYATHPPEVKERIELGGLEDISYEQLTALAPDMIIVQNVSERLADYAAAREITLVNLVIETIQDVYAACRSLGMRLGRPEEGHALAAQIEASLDRVRSKVAGQKKTACFLSVDRNPGPLVGVLSAGKRTFLNQLVEIAGGRNVFDDMSIRYPMVSKESLLVRRPEVVLEFKPGMVSDEDKRRLKKDWRALSGLPAVVHGRVFVVAHEDALIPGPRMAEVAEQVALKLHPEIEDRTPEEVETDGI